MQLISLRIHVVIDMTHDISFLLKTAFLSSFEDKKINESLYTRQKRGRYTSGTVNILIREIEFENYGNQRF